MTERAFVLGHPVGQSKSPAMHNAVYRACGLSWEYGLADCATADEARAFLEQGDWRVLNVTMPYKPLALAIADVPSAAAQIAGGANVLIRDRIGRVSVAGADAAGCASAGADAAGRASAGADAAGRVFADNTDGAGCMSYLERCGARVQNARAVICGTGPTAVSIMHACACAGAASIALLSRSAEKAADALARYAKALASCGSNASVSGRMEALSYEEAAGAIDAADIIIDATPLGMKPADPAPFDTALLHENQVVLDVVYGHGETALVHDARAAGCRAFDGAGMLVGQAVETLRDMEKALDDFELPSGFDAFAIMAAAAGFE